MQGINVTFSRIATEERGRNQGSSIDVCMWREGLFFI